MAGRPQFIVTPEIIQKAEKLASRGLTKEQIAACLGICYDTLNERSKESSEFSEALERGKAKGINLVAKALLKNVKKGNVTAQMFYLRSQGKWSDSSPEEKIDELKNELAEMKGLISKCVQPIP